MALPEWEERLVHKIFGTSSTAESLLGSTGGGESPTLTEGPTALLDALLIDCLAASPPILPDAVARRITGSPGPVGGGGGGGGGGENTRGVSDGSGRSSSAGSTVVRVTIISLYDMI